MDKQTVLEELKRRQKEKLKEDSQIKFVFDEFCFKAQKSFFEDRGVRFKTAVCGRRSGKTVGIAADLIHTCTTEKNVICLYLTLSKRNARNIIWSDVQKILIDYKIDCKINQVEMSVLFNKTGSKINIEGAKDRSEAEKYRGWKLRKCYIDEAQSFRPYIKELIKEIIRPALQDLRGILYLTGTPGPIPAGYFFDCAHNKIWENHKWTAFDNPFMHNPPDRDLEDTLKEDREIFGITELDPSYQRETFGLWVEDYDSLVYKYKADINDYNILPKGEYEYIMGVDIGYDDADAIAVLAYSKDHNRVYLAEEFVQPKQDISKLAETIKELDEAYGCIKKVIDSGGLGKKIQEEIVNRYGINLEAAEKHRKVEFIELMNADLRKGALRAKSSSRFAEDCKLVQWDRDKSTPDKLTVSSIYHSDICDAVLYAYREARHYLYEKPIVEPHRDTDEYMKKFEEQEAQKILDKQNENDFEITPDEIQAYERLMFEDEI